MRFGLILLLLSVVSWSQTSTTGKAQTQGPCSPAVTGSNNQFTINCENISKEQGAEFLKILNKIARDQLDPKLVMEKLNEIAREVRGLEAAQAPRRLTSAQETRFIEMLSPFAGQKIDIVVYYTNAPDAVDLGQQIQRLCLQAGWLVSYLPVGNMSGNARVGVFAFGSPTPAFHTFQQVFDGTNIQIQSSDNQAYLYPATIFRDKARNTVYDAQKDGRPPDLISLRIGKKP